MDDALRQQIAAWLEYYRDLGIEEFYRCATRQDFENRKSKLETRNSKAEIQKEMEPGTRFSASTEPRFPSPETRTPSPESRITTPDSRAPIAPPPLSLSLFEAPEPVRGPETLEQIRADLGDCQRCKLAGGRKKIVFGQGNPHAELVFVGEGPGADEDEQGLPFVGRAGQLLNRMIQFVGMKREEVYICNIVKCRPPGNRTPEKMRLIPARRFSSASLRRSSRG